MEVQMPVNGVDSSGAANVEQMRRQERQQAADQAQSDQKAKVAAADRDQQARQNRTSGGAVDVKA
jgi:hypothetical protein